MPLILLLGCPGPPDGTLPAGRLVLETTRVEVTELDLDRDSHRDVDFDVANAGDASLWVDVSGFQDVESWAEVQANGAMLEPGESDTIRLRYQPRHVGWEQGSVLLNTSDPTQPVAAVALYGSTLGSWASVSPEEEHLGDVGLGCTGSLDFEVRNEALDDLVLEGFELSDGAFEIAGELPVTLPAGTAADFQLLFAAEDVGYHETRLGVLGSAANSGGFLALFAAEANPDLEPCGDDTGL